eukprot:GHVN01104563.1.p1 GENE.GHVN01104563.1~~GHVN01104563.1.p1  ORF type:complete len:151 (+),score=19.93 GHVN01104563.1:50-454(+)
MEGVTKLKLSASSEQHIQQFQDSEKLTLNGKISKLDLKDYACQLISRFENLDDATVKMDCWKEQYLPPLGKGEKITLNGKISELWLEEYACELIKKKRFDGLGANVNVMMDGKPYTGHLSFRVRFLNRLLCRRS